jgi:hypothetical protein
VIPTGACTGVNESNDFLKLPGYVGRPLVNPDDDKEEAKVRARPTCSLFFGVDRSEKDASAVRFCRKCALYKPDRAHHCSQLGHCVLRMDHFCPW